MENLDFLKSSSSNRCPLDIYGSETRSQKACAVWWYKSRSETTPGTVLKQCTRTSQVSPGRHPHTCSQLATESPAHPRKFWVSLLLVHSCGHSVRTENPNTNTRHCIPDRVLVQNCKSIVLELLVLSTSLYEDESYVGIHRALAGKVL